VSGTPEDFTTYKIRVAIDGPELEVGTEIEVTLYGTIIAASGGPDSRRIMVEDWRGPTEVQHNEAGLDRRLAELSRAMEVLQAEVQARPRP
jgi:hypothetical protein